MANATIVKQKNSIEIMEKRLEEMKNMSGEDLRDEKLIKEKFPIFLICSIV